MVRICIPGTGGMLPLPERWLSCCYAEWEGSALLFDCGEGTQIALKKAGCALRKIDTVLLSHYHADHVSGLPGLLLAMSNSEKTTPLCIAGPPGLREVVTALRVIAPALSFPVKLVECGGDGAADLPGFEQPRISFLTLSHGIPCVAYRIEYRRKPVFNPAKAEELRVPVSLYRRLHAGEPATLPDGRAILPEMVTDGARAPVVFCYITDTRPVPDMERFVRDADLLICEGMHADEAMREKMENKGHMLFSDSARLSANSHVKRLLLTHFSPALTRPEEHLQAARIIFKRTETAYDGYRTTLGGRK